MIDEWGAQPGRKERYRQIVSGLLALVIVVAAFGLRTEDLHQPLVDHFSWREASTAMMADNLPANGWNPLWPEVSWTGDQPGYQGREFQTLTVAAALLDALLGWRDWHGRLVAAICGAISTFALFRLVSALHGRRLGLLAAAVYAVLPGAILIDRSYLPDPAMLALALVALWMLAEGLSRARASWIVAGWAIGTLALLAKLPAIAALPAAIYLVLAAAPRERPRSHLAWLVAALAASGALVGAYYLWAIHLGRTYPPYHIAGHGWLWDYGFAAFWKEKFYLGVLRWHIETWLWTPAVIVLAAAGFFASLDMRRRAAERGQRLLDAPWFFHFWVAGCAAFYVTAALEVGDNPWNLHIFNPPAAAFAAVGIDALIKNSGARSGAKRFLAAAAILLVILFTGRAGLKQKYDSVGARDHALGVRLAALSCRGEMVIASGTDAGSPVAIFYSRRRGWIFPPPEHSPAGNYAVYGGDGPPALAALDDLVRRGADWFGVVKIARDLSDPRRPFAEHYARLLEHLRTRARTAYEDDEIIIFDLAPLAGRARAPCGPE